MNENILLKFKSISTFIFDVDGVLATNFLLVTTSGELLRQMNSKDGMAIRKAVDTGYQVIIITGGKNMGVVKRLKGLGIKEVYYGIEDKLNTYQELFDAYGWKQENILYMGDDVNDYEVMQAVGLSCAPKNAVPEIINIAQYISPINGGEGCVRDVIEKVMKLRGNWFETNLS